jgi:hypothetical protein
MTLTLSEIDGLMNVKNAPALFFVKFSRLYKFKAKPWSPCLYGTKNIIFNFIDTEKKSHENNILTG